MATRRTRVGTPHIRQRLVSLFALALLVVFAFRLIDIQGIRSAELSQQALDTRLATAQIEVPRANIVDRNGVVLAQSVERYNVGVNQAKIATFVRKDDRGTVIASGPADAAAILAPILGLDAAELGAQLVGDQTWVYIAKDITPETWALVEAEKISGVEPERVADRIYPNGSIAGNVIGFVGGSSEGPGLTGLAGLELAENEILTGTPGTMTYERSAAGGMIIPTGVREETPATPGKTVVTTIDRDMQWYTEQQVAEELKKVGASRAIVVVQDTTTGEILTLVDSYAVDPNDPGASDAEDRGSRAVSDVFEPGSTAKVITMAAAIEEGLVTPTSHVKAPYKFTTENGQEFRDSHKHPTLKLTVNGVLAESSNTGTVQIGSMMSEETRYHYLTAFGLGSPTGVGLPGESGGNLAPFEKWDGRQKYAVLFGQALSVTGVQTAQVYQTIANGGVRLQPTLVKGYVDEDGTFTPRETADGTRVVSEETASQVLTMLESVTSDGTGTAAEIPGYRVAGKTGTAQASSGNGKLDSIVASYVGIAPADDPRIVVSVIVFDPHSSIYGGVVAAPLFKKVATFALQTLRVPPSDDEADLYPITWK